MNRYDCCTLLGGVSNTCEIRCNSCGASQSCDYVIAPKTIGTICTPKQICNAQSGLCPIMARPEGVVTELNYCDYFHHCQWDLDSSERSDIEWKICDIKLTYSMDIGMYCHVPARWSLQ